MTAIEARELTKVFRRPVRTPGLRGAFAHLLTRRHEDHVAVRSVDMSVEEGEAVAYLGPNGAGKSTTIKLLTGILRPTSGHVRVHGVVPFEQRTANARNVGVVFGQRSQLWGDLPVRDSFELLRAMYRVSERRYRTVFERLDAVLDLSGLLPVTARTLSLGQRMRADLAAACLHEPKVLYLDEPTIGLDISVRDRVRAFLRELTTGQRTTLVLTTHDLADVEEVCDRVVLVDDGRIVHDGSLEDVKNTFARHREIHFQVRGEAPLAELTRLLDPEQVLPAAGGGDFSVRFDRGRCTAQDVLTAVLTVAEVLDFRVQEAGIQDVLRRAYAGELFDGTP